MMQKQESFFGKGQWLDLLAGLCAGICIRVWVLCWRTSPIPDPILRDFLWINLAMAFIVFLGETREPSQLRQKEKAESGCQGAKAEEGWPGWLLFSCGLLALLVAFLFRAWDQRVLLSFGAALVACNLFFGGILRKIGEISGVKRNAGVLAVSALLAYAFLSVTLQ